MVHSEEAHAAAIRNVVITQHVKAITWKTTLCNLSSALVEKLANNHLAITHFPAAQKNV